MVLFFRVLLWVVLCACFFAPVLVRAQVKKDEVIKRGEYIFAVAGGCACHTVPKGEPHAGGRVFPIPLGKIYSTNITPDEETGIGRWTEVEIHRSMVQGVRPTGERILPVMPYEAYSGMAEDDIRALIAYLKTLKPVRKGTPSPQTWLPLVRSVFTPPWLKLFGRFSNPPAQAPQGGIERGRYLVEHVALCADCHTPRNAIGVPNRTLYLAGNKSGPFDEEIPNITPDKQTGIGEWSREDIANLLLKGDKPDGDTVQGLMAEVIEAGYKRMKKEDALAIADYLKSVPPVANKIR
jgi:mono/diheme cytochrome c family protein